MSMVALPQFSNAVVIMGVASCGKSTLGEAVAKALDVPFVEGDALHGAANVAKMSAGIALNDNDRWPWLTRIGQALAGQDGCVASCSALKKAYRAAIIAAAGRDVIFIHLHGTPEQLAARIAARKGHFMPPSLLASQLAVLELPEADEHVLTLDIALQPEIQLERALNFLKDRII